MMTTEEEAKAKRCQETFGPTPPVTITTYPVFPANPFGHDINQPMQLMPTHCIGSGCMAWRIALAAIPPQYERIELPSEEVADLTKGWERDGEIFAHSPWQPGDGTPTFQNWRRVVAVGEPHGGRGAEGLNRDSR
jgi:hypothetical protein